MIKCSLDPDCLMQGYTNSVCLLTSDYFSKFTNRQLKGSTIPTDNGLYRWEDHIMQSMLYCILDADSRMQHGHKTARPHPHTRVFTSCELMVSILPLIKLPADRRVIARKLSKICIILQFGSRQPYTRSHYLNHPITISAEASDAIYECS